jgi:hypothetical protein
MKMERLLGLYGNAAYFSLLNMGAAGSSETLTPIYQTTRRYTPEGSYFQYQSLPDSAVGMATNYGLDG